MTSANRPHNAIADMLYQPMVELKHKVASFSDTLSDESWTKLRNATMRQDASMMDDTKHTSLMSDATRLGIQVSRLPQFRRRFNDALQGALKSYKTRGELPGSVIGKEETQC